MNDPALFRTVATATPRMPKLIKEPRAAYLRSTSAQRGNYEGPNEMACDCDIETDWAWKGAKAMCMPYSVVPSELLQSHH